MTPCRLPTGRKSETAAVRFDLYTWVWSVMTQFTISLAGIPIGVSAVYPSTEELCREYITEDAPAFSVFLTETDIDREWEISKRRAEASGVLARRFSDRYLESLALYRKIADALIEYDTLLIHGAAVAVDGETYLFTAPSGTGKTTHTRLWLENIPGAYVVNGDKPLIRFADGGAFVCGTPWRGKERLGRNAIVPLKAVCILERACDNSIEKTTVGDAFGALLRQTHIPENKLAEAVGLLGRLGGAAIYRLGCNMEPEAALISYGAMRE